MVAVFAKAGDLVSLLLLRSVVCSSLLCVWEASLDGLHHLDSLALCLPVV